MFQIQESLAFVSSPFNLTIKYEDPQVPAIANPPGYQTLPRGKEDAQLFSLSFRLALENFVLVAGLLPAPAPCLLPGTQTQETECICIPSASPVGTGSSSQSSAPSYSLRTVPLTFPTPSSHLVNRENFRDTISQGTNRQQMAHSTENGRRWFYL